MPAVCIDLQQTHVPRRSRYSLPADFQATPWQAFYEASVSFRKAKRQQKRKPNYSIIFPER
ncbi:MAG: hypothetical protein IKW74_04210 [Thermoguttaceae bacterium]|nr:hypothetical protein [Thermoguttaceae bacterium]